MRDGGWGGICHHPLNLGLGVDSRLSQGRSCMMTVVTISSSCVASITPRSTLLDTIIQRTESCHGDTVNILSLDLPTPDLDLTSTWPAGTAGRLGRGFKFKQIKHRQDHPVGREEGSDISQMLLTKNGLVDISFSYLATRCSHSQINAIFLSASFLNN